MLKMFNKLIKLVMIICVAASLFFKAEVVDVSAEGLPTNYCTVTLKGNTLIVGDGNPCTMNQGTLGYSSTLDKSSVENIVINPNVFAPVWSNSMFYEFQKLTSIVGIENINTSYTSSIGSMFQGCYSLESIDISSWNKSNISNAQYAFANCPGIKNADISNWNFTGKDIANTLRYMFSGSSGVQVLNMNNFKVPGSLSNFIRNIGINGYYVLNVYDWDLSGVTSLASMFQDMYYITEIHGIDTWVNTSSIITAAQMFYGCSNLKCVEFGAVDFSSLENIYGMFQNCYSALEELDFSEAIMPSINITVDAFNRCNKLRVIDLSGMVGSNITQPAQMFYTCENLETIYVDNSWGEMRQSVSHYPMFAYNTKLVGGEGTGFESGKNTAVYAHLDEGSSNPGYFTLADLKGPKKEGRYTAIYNEPYHGFKLLKTSSYDNGPVEGAQFRVWGMSDYGTEYYETAESNSNGVVDFEGFEPGTYLMQEVQAPEHYLLDSTQRVVKIKKNGDVSISGLVDTGVYHLVENERLEDDEIVIVKKWNDRKTGSEANGREYPVVTISSDMPETNYMIIYDLNNKGYFENTTSSVNTVIYDFSDETPRVIGGQEMNAVPKSVEYDHVDRWYYDRELTKPYTPGEIPEENMVTLYADWIETTYMPYANNFMSVRYNGRSDIAGGIKHIVRAESLPSDISYTQYALVTAGAPLYYWIDINTFTLYWYTESNKVRTDTLYGLFSNCNSLEDEDFTLYLTNEGAAETNTSRSEIYHAFYNCYNLKEIHLPLVKWDMITSVDYMFYNCKSIESVSMPTLDVSNVTSARYVFSNTTNVNLFQDALQNMDWSSIETMEGMFRNAEWEGTLDLTAWKDTVESAKLSYLFSTAKGNALNIQGWKLPSSTKADGMLSDVRFEYINMNGVTFHTDISYSYGLSNMLHYENKGPLTVDMNNTEWYGEYSSPSIFYCARGSSADVPVYLNLRNAKIHQKNIACGMFYALQNAVVDLSNWQFLDNEITLNHMFYTSKDNVEIIGLNTWDWSNISDVSDMISYSQKESIDLGRFNIPDGCNVENMFHYASQLQTIYVNEEFKGLPNVINGDTMFSGTSKLIGGAGTKSSEVIKNYNDSTRLSDTVYFRVDGGSASPGLLTLKN